MARVLDGEPTILSPVLRPVERFVYRICGIDETVRAGLEGVCRRAPPLQPRRDRRDVRDAAAPGRPAAQPQRRAAVRAGPGLQHRRQLRDEHELAELLGRGRQPPHPVGRAHRPELHLRGRGHRDRGGAHPRPRPAQLVVDRQLLGRPHPLDALHPAAPRGRRCGRARLAGRDPDLRRAGGREHARRSRADDRPRALRLAGDHQGARHERRRSAQRELSAPVREPDAAHELDRDARDPHHPVRPDLHVRPHGRRPAPGLDDLRGDGRRARRGRGRGDGRGDRRQPALPGGRRPAARQHGRQGGPLRLRRGRPVGRRHDGHQHRCCERDARQLPADRRARAALPHAARRGRPGRRRRRPLRDARPGRRSCRSSSRGSWSAARPSTWARRSRASR